MEYSNPKIKFYKVRNFSEKMSVAFDFLRENWKSLLKFSFYLILPICLFQSFALNSSMKYLYTMGYDIGAGGSTADIISVVLNYVLYMLFILFGTSVLNAMVYSLMSAYEQRENRLATITLQELKPSLVKNTVKLLRALLLFACFIILASLLLFGLLMIFASFIPLFVILILALMAGVVFLIVPLSLFMPVYLFEDISFSEALKKAFNYGFSYWGGTFAIVFVFGFLANMISGVTMMPWYIMLILGQLLSIDAPGAGINASIGYQFVSYLLGIIQSYGLYLSYMLTAVGIAFQYFHLREKKEGVTVDANIQNFDML
jgi:hypothetical protein